MSTQHAHEVTAYSLTDTVVDNGDKPGRPTLPSAFSGSTLTTTNPDLIQGTDPRHPTRNERAIDPRLTPATIPPDHPHRTLILCFDGTGDQFDDDNSNIVQLVSLLKKNDRSKQMVYYQTGIGTYTSPQVVSPFMSKVWKTLDVMVAWSLDAHVMSAFGQ
ncbi:hypothetical protein DXG03_008691 [Asterophora parasitica]|uniref:T6SS Phospholipase effector Tle1-like catalytic domain-containing protein n=1 Tax=Asterophora parasitica TaxID=117018 RepID=A0A9P7GBT0_9AGAR|nr:hypothetical protein DXG03_008691 [Asterophora parasitica]